MKYRPSNGSEGDWFMEKFCCHCKHSDKDGFCPIIDASMAFETDDLRYPKEWVVDEDGHNPRCSKFYSDTKPGTGGRINNDKQ